MYRTTFNGNYNLGFFHPKKDQCSDCTKFDLMNAIDQENGKIEIEEHRERNAEAQAAKAVDKERAKG